jgi:ATP-dependent RNA helicase DDX23/PRP28
MDVNGVKGGAEKQPISVEEILRKKKLENEIKSKPRFISKAERQRIAIEKRANEVDEVRKSGSPSNGAMPLSGIKRTSEDIRNRATLVRARNDRHSEDGQERQGKKRRHDKFRFEWNADDDTLNNSDLLYRYSSRGSEVGSVVPPVQGGGYEERMQRHNEMEVSKQKTKVDWDDVHWSEKPKKMMRERDWRIFKEDYKILTKGGDIPSPLRFWDESSISRVILDTIKSLGYNEPTPIQRAAIPIALTNRDVIGIAETGSGKTASFVIPMLTYIMELPALTELTKTDGPYAIVLAPTRELAQQIEIETRKFCGPMGFRCASVVGGHSIEEQAYKLQEGAEIVIATPGRLLDCIDRRVLVLSQCCYVVMDEADRMIDLGFEEQINKVLSALPVSNERLNYHNHQIASNASHLNGRKYRQTMMYTATWPKAIERLAEKYLRNPGIVTIGNVGQATERVEQRIEMISGEEKRKKRLREILATDRYSAPIIIFVNLKRNCDLVAKALIGDGWKVATMHGSKSQEQREQALAQLKSGAVDCLVATDVAGRGIDVQNVSLVVNFQMARTVESYTHRIGRTGRAGKMGVAITFLGKEDEDLFYDLKILLQRSGVTKLPEELRSAKMRSFQKKPDKDQE